MSNLDLVVAREKELKPLYDRFDLDADRLDWTHLYQLMRLDDPNTAMDNVVNVTMNSAATYVNDLAILISQATLQTVIEGTKNGRPMSDKETSKIESFLDAHYDMIDDALGRQGDVNLMIWLANHFVARGWAAGRYWAWVDNDTYIPGYKPWDTRYVAWENGTKGLNWASYRTKRMPRDLKREYPDAIITGDKEIEVVIFYDDEVEEVWVENDLIKTKPHNFGYVPIIIQPAPVGFQLQRAGSIQHEGESALFLDRLLYDELNRSVSIEQTLAQKAALPAYSRPKASGTAGDEPYPDKVGAVTTYPPGEQPTLLPVGDFGNAAQRGRADILEALQQGGRNVDIGNINGGWSAVAIAATEEIRKKALIPRFQGVSAYLTKLSGMMIQQYQSLGKSVNFNSELGLPGRRMNYSDTDLAGDYSIRYRLMSKSKEMEIANIVIASAAKGQLGLPDEVIVRDILLYDNPNELLTKMAAQKAENADPVIMLTRLAHRLIDEAEGLDGEQKNEKLIESMGLIDKAIEIILPPVPTQPSPLPTPDQPGGGGNLLPALLGAGNRGGQGQTTAVGG